MADPLFPARQARCVRQMTVGGGHILHIEESGPLHGIPVLFLHGGPGSGCNPAQRRLFDPERFRVFMIDQRGAGRSLPRGELDANTTLDLVADLDYVRKALGISGWIVFGGSWGSLLALVYAQIFPENVYGLVLRGIFLGSRREIDAYVEGCTGILHDPLLGQGLDALAQRILGADPEAAIAATQVWLNYERLLMGELPLPDLPDAKQLAKARIQMHYLINDCFLISGQVLAGIDVIRHLPAAIVQGLADPVCPPQTAELVHRAWPEALWVPVVGGGHGALSPAIASACIDALARVAACVED